MFISRREMLARYGAGFGSLGLAALLNSVSRSAEAKAANPLAPKEPHFTAKAKRVIYLFMNGGPSHVDTFDHKPALVEQEGSRGPVVSTRRRRLSSPNMAKAAWR